MSYRNSDLFQTVWKHIKVNIVQPKPNNNDSKDTKSEYNDASQFRSQRCRAVFLQRAPQGITALTQQRLMSNLLIITYTG